MVTHANNKALPNGVVSKDGREPVASDGDRLLNQNLRRAHAVSLDFIQNVVPVGRDRLPCPSLETSLYNLISHEGVVYVLLKDKQSNINDIERKYPYNLKLFIYDRSKRSTSFPECFPDLYR